MTISVQLPADYPAIDEASRRKILGVLEQISDDLTAIPPASAFWRSIDTSLLQLDLEGLHVLYRIEPDHRSIQVIELQQVPR